MKRIKLPKHRYGEPDFDAEYLEWGFHDEKTQVREAESVLAVLKPTTSLRFLDLACGIGIHAVHWATQGHVVTAVDISETFLAKARARAVDQGSSVEYVVSDVHALAYDQAFDVVTWIEGAGFDQDMVGRIHGFLDEGGRYVLDARNPDSPKARFRGSDWRTWREADGIFYLERHETDEETGQHEDVWITIDTHREVIEEQANISAKSLDLHRKIEVLKRSGFRSVELWTMEAEPFTVGEDPYWLWVVATK